MNLSTQRCSALEEARTRAYVDSISEIEAERTRCVFVFLPSCVCVATALPLCLSLSLFLSLFLSLSLSLSLSLTLSLSLSLSLSLFSFSISLSIAPILYHPFLLPLPFSCFSRPSPPFLSISVELERNTWMLLDQIHVSREYVSQIQKEATSFNHNLLADSIRKKEPELCRAHVRSLSSSFFFFLSLSPSLSLSLSLSLFSLSLSLSLPPLSLSIYLPYPLTSFTPFSTSVRCSMAGAGCLPALHTRPIPLWT